VSIAVESFLVDLSLSLSRSSHQLDLLSRPEPINLLDPWPALGGRTKQRDAGGTIARMDGLRFTFDCSRSVGRDGVIKLVNYYLMVLYVDKD